MSDDSRKFELPFNEDGQYYHFFDAVRQTLLSNIYNTVHDIFHIYLVNCVMCTPESRIIGGVGIIGGLDIVIIINNRERGWTGLKK